MEKNYMEAQEACERLRSDLMMLRGKADDVDVVRNVREREIEVKMNQLERDLERARKEITKSEDGILKLQEKSYKERLAVETERDALHERISELECTIKDGRGLFTETLTAEQRDKENLNHRLTLTLTLTLTLNPNPNPNPKP